jgi:hypothetical protein
MAGIGIDQQGGRNDPGARLAEVQQATDEKFWTPREWAIRSNIPYRAILRAAASGELAAVRPSGTAHGKILISESSWRQWLTQIGLRRRRPGRVSEPTQDRPRAISELTLS